jgi:hypothetical protein
MFSKVMLLLSVMVACVLAADDSVSSLIASFGLPAIVQWVIVGILGGSGIWGWLFKNKMIRDLRDAVNSLVTLFAKLRNSIKDPELIEDVNDSLEHIALCFEDSKLLQSKAALIRSVKIKTSVVIVPVQTVPAPELVSGNELAG